MHFGILFYLTSHSDSITWKSDEAKQEEKRPGRKQPLRAHRERSGRSWFWEELGQKLHPARPVFAPQQCGAPRSDRRSYCQRPPESNQD
jgi:hypothetical protein